MFSAVTFDTFDKKPISYSQTKYFCHFDVMCLQLDENVLM